MNENSSTNQFRPPSPLIGINKPPHPLFTIPIEATTTKQSNFNFSGEHSAFAKWMPLNQPTMSQQPSTMQTISTSHNPAIHTISSPPPPLYYPFSSKRKRKARGGKRELIDLAKQQLQQLNESMAALEAVVENDEHSNDGERFNPAQLPNDSLPHQPLPRIRDNHTPVGVETDGFTQKMKPISRPEPRWSNPISIENPVNSFLPTAGQLTLRNDAVATIPGW